MHPVVLFVIIALSLWLSAVTYFLYKINTHYQRLLARTGSDRLSEILDKILSDLAKWQNKTSELSDKVKILSQDSGKYIQKIGILRFNPFGDTGGDQSFVLAMLDGTDTGIVLTSLHSRGTSRWYAKNVKEGKGIDHELSEEEKKVIKQAILVGEKNKEN